MLCLSDACTGAKPTKSCPPRPASGPIPDIDCVERFVRDGPQPDSLHCSVLFDHLAADEDYSEMVSPGAQAVVKVDNEVDLGRLNLSMTEPLAEGRS